MYQCTCVMSQLLCLTKLLPVTHLVTVSMLLQMVGLYKDPSGENVFQDKANTFAQEESNVMALRRDVQQLRVSLHLAQVTMSVYESRVNIANSYINLAEHTHHGTANIWGSMCL